MKTKPRTKREWALYRAQLSCKVGRDALENVVPKSMIDVPPLNYAVFCLMGALGDMIEAMSEDSHQADQPRKATK